MSEFKTPKLSTKWLLVGLFLFALLIAVLTIMYDGTTTGVMIETILSIGMVISLLSQSYLFIIGGRGKRVGKMRVPLGIVALLLAVGMAVLHFPDSYFTVRKQIAQKRTLANFQKIEKGDTEREVKELVGMHDRDIGSRPYVFLYKMSDDSEMFVSFTNKVGGSRLKSVVSVTRVSTDGVTDVLVK